MSAANGLPPSRKSLTRFSVVPQVLGAVRWNGPIYLTTDIHHQMHHRYFECNYGNLEVPWDKWFGSFHDGTETAHEQMKARRRRLAGSTRWQS